MHIIVPFEPEYCAQCGEILSTDGFCMRCDGMQIEDEEEEFVLDNQEETTSELKIKEEPETVYENNDTIANGPREERDTGSDDESGQSSDDMPAMLWGHDE